MKRFGAVFALYMIAAMAAPHPARGQNLIDASSSIGDVPDYAGTGLWGLYYDNADGFSSAAGSPAQATFMTTNACYPNCSNNFGSFTDTDGGLALFTNGNATNITFLNPQLPIRTTWDNSELDLSGYIAIKMPGTYSFSITTDDSTVLTIGGSSLQVLFPHPGSAAYTFTKAGLYPISLQFLEFGGGSLLSLTATDPNGACILGCYDGNLLANDSFYSDQQLEGAPAPAIGGGWPGMLAGLVGAGLLIRRRGEGFRPNFAPTGHAGPAVPAGNSSLPA